jgi:hypothetical protein
MGATPSRFFRVYPFSWKGEKTLSAGMADPFKTVCFVSEMNFFRKNSNILYFYGVAYRVEDVNGSGSLLEGKNGGRCPSYTKLPSNK